MRWFRPITLLVIVATVAGSFAAADDLLPTSNEIQSLFDDESDALVALPPVPPAEAAGEASGDMADEIQRLRERLEKIERIQQDRLIREEEDVAEQESHRQQLSDLRKQISKSSDKPPDNKWFDVSDEKWNIRLGGDVQMDSVNWAYADPSIKGPAAAPGARDYFEFRRLRLLAEGTGYGVYDFRLQMTLEPDTTGDTQIIPAGGGQLNPNTPSVKDAFFTIHEVPWLGRVRIGNFFVPFGLEQVTNDRFGVFLERSIPTQGVFTADRQVGIAAYNTNDAQNVTWTFGTFYDNISDTQKSKIDNNQGVRVSGRVTYLPYYDESSNGRYLVHTGAGVLYVDRYNHTVQFRTRPEIHQGPRLVDTGPLDAQTYTSGNIEGAIVMGTVTVQSEAFVTSVDISDKGPATFYGAYAHISWFLTGENRAYERFGQHGAQFGRTLPINNVFFTPGGSSWGAWEAKARYSFLSLDAVDKGRIDDMTLGMNWYWSDRTRCMFDYIHTMTSRQATFGSTQSDIIAMRFDFNW